VSSAVKSIEGAAAPGSQWRWTLSVKRSAGAPHSIWGSYGVHSGVTKTGDSEGVRRVASGLSVSG